jgi:HlyD family secretion protein
MSNPVDLQQLVVNRAAPSARPLAQRRPWLTRWGIPLGIVAGFLGITGWSARESLLPATKVTVVPVYLTRAEVQASGTPLFQAAGWIEPRPSPVIVTALVEGIVDKMLVVEGEAVEVGQPVAQLFDADARLALREAQAALQLKQAESAIAQATLKAAKQNLEQPVHLEAAHAEAEAVLAKLQTEIKNLPFAIQAAEARLALARQDWEGKKSIADALSGRAVQRSQAELQVAIAAVEELRQREPSLAAELKAVQRKCEALHSRLGLKTDETRGQEEAVAGLSAAQARVVQAELAVEAAKLRCDRMTIHSPIRGRVLALNARPGQRLMGINAASERDASTVISLYDPQQLQIRADVRLEDVAQVQVGQPVQITTAALNQTLQGQVLAVTSSADIQKNTLQVKVSIEQPPAVIKPEMLAQVVFLAPVQPQSEINLAQAPLRLLVPKAVIVQSDAGATVWIVDPQGSVARRKSVQLGTASSDQLVEVTQGLSALDKLIVSGRESLTEGTRIRITGEDQALGAMANAPANHNTASLQNPSGTK